MLIGMFHEHIRTIRMSFFCSVEHSNPASVAQKRMPCAIKVELDNSQLGGFDAAAHIAAGCLPLSEHFIQIKVFDLVAPMCIVNRDSAASVGLYLDILLQSGPEQTI